MWDFGDFGIALVKQIGAKLLSPLIIVMLPKQT
jgi:hypothetical protein